MSNLETVLADAGYEQINADLIEQLKKKQEAGTLTAAEANLLAEIEALGLDLSTLDGQALTAEDLQALGDAQVSLPSPASAPFASGGLGGLAGLGALGGGGGGASGGTAVAVVANSFNGQLINGYIQGAEVFQDINNDGIWNAGEPKGTTDSLGRFTLSGYVNGGGMLIASTTENTIDTSTGLRVTTEFKAPADSAVISPLSTLLTEEGMTQDLIKSAFDIDDSIDILTFDPISSAENAATAELASMALKFKSVSNQVSNLIDVGVSTIDSSSNEDAAGVSAAVVEKLVAKIKAVPTDLDLTDDDIISDVLTEASAELSTADLATAIASAATQLGALNLKIGEIVPEDLVLFSSVSSEQDFDGHFNDVQTFGNGATFNFTTAVDPNGAYDRVAHVASGTGYAPNVNVAFAAFQSIGTGFATGFEGFNAKVSNTPNGRLEVKLIGAGAGMDSVADITLATYSGATDLGNGWFDVTIPFTDFSNPGNIPAHSGYLIGMPGDNGADAFDFYFTDVGFDDFTDVSASLESINKATKVAQSDLETMIQTAIEQGDFSALANFDLDAAVSGAELYTPEGVDLTLFSSSDASGDYSPATLYDGVTPFESGATFDFQTAVDPNGVYDRVGRVTSGTGYGPQIALVAFPDVNGAGDSAGFADGYDAFQAKVASTPNGQLTVKFFGGADNSPESVVTINLNDTDVSTDLGNGWYDVEIPFTDFSNPNEISGHQGFLIEANTTDADPFDFYFTDLGLNGVARDASDVDLTGYSLAFEDNFDEIGSGPDSDDWTFDLGNDGWGNNEVQNYQGDLDDAVIVDVGAGDTVNGALQITAQRSGGEITSARVRSDIDLPAYGYYEVRAKLPAEAGAWPAIWLLGDGGRATWPNEGEIDLVEWSSLYASSDSEIISAMHFPDNHGGNALDTNETLDTPVTQWHTYQAWWTPTEIAIGVDGTRADAHLVYEKPAGADNDAWPFDGGMDLIMNIAIGGTLGGTGNVPAGDFSYNMLIDYVRVYQNPDHVSSGSGTGATAPSTEATAPTEQAADVISVFSDSYTDVAVSDYTPNWGGAGTAVVENGRIKISGMSYQGIQIADPNNGNSGTIDASAKESLNVDVWMPQAGSFKWFLISSGTGEESSVTLTGNAGWNSFNIDLDAFSGVDLTDIIQFKLDNAGLSDAATDFYLDNIYFNDTASDTAVPTAPSTEATAPTEQAADVISVFSDSYTDVAVSDYTPNWGGAGTAAVENGRIKISGMSYQGIQIADPNNGNSGTIDASAKESLNVDVWMPQAGSFKWFLISSGTGEESSVTLTGNAGWNSFNIDLDAFSGVDLTDIIQFKLDNAGLSDAATDFYLDNIYFNDTASDTAVPTAPSTEATAPTEQAADVISVFSDSYTDVAVSDYTPNWGGAGTAAVENGRIKISGMSYQGIQIADPNNGNSGTIDASAKESLNVDVWMPQAGSFKWFLISSGTGEESSVTLTGNAGWNSFNIDLDAFSGVDLTDIIQFKLDNAGLSDAATDFYLDNIYFNDTASDTAVPTAPSTEATAPTEQAADVISVFSDSYTDVAVSDYTPNWGGAGTAAVENGRIKISGMSYQGIQIADPNNGNSGTIDASAKESLNVDVWMPEAGSFKWFLISSGTGEESSVTLTGNAGWNSFNIDLDAFSGVDLTDIIQFKLDNAGLSDAATDFYLDNIYFNDSIPTTGTPVPSSGDASTLQITFEADDDSGFELGSTNDFGGNLSSAVAGTDAPVDRSGTIAKAVKGAAGTPSEVWAGTTFLDLGADGGDLISTEGSTVTVEVFVPGDNVTVKLKLEDSEHSTHNFEVDAQTASDGTNAWETLTFDFSNANQSVDFNKASIFFDFGNAGAGEEYYFDDVTFNGFIS